MEFRCSLPYVYGALAANAAVLMNSATRRPPGTAFGFPTILARSVCPEFDGVPFTVTVKYLPDDRLTMLSRLQPPNTASVQGALFAPNLRPCPYGSCHSPLNTNDWERFVANGPYSPLRFAGF